MRSGFWRPRSLLSPWLTFWLLACGAKPVGGTSFSGHSPSYWALAGGGQQAEDEWATSLGTGDYGMHMEHSTIARSALWNKLVPPQIQCATEAVGGKRISSSVRAVSLSSQGGNFRGETETSKCRSGRWGNKLQSQLRPMFVKLSHVRSKHEDETDERPKQVG